MRYIDIEPLVFFHIVRHAAAVDYGGGTRNPVFSLTPEGDVEAEQVAEKILDLLGPGVLLTLQSSNTNRTLETARAILALYRPPQKPKLEEALREVDNFDFRFFGPVVLGGNVRHSETGDVFNINTKLTNPRRLSPVDYYRKTEWQRLNRSLQEKVPSWLFGLMEQIESPRSVNERMFSHLKNVSGQEFSRDQTHHVVMVTHQAPTFHLVERATSGATTIGLRTGGILSMQRISEDNLVPIGITGISTKKIKTGLNLLG